MARKLKVKSFYGGRSRLDGAHEYQAFIRNNPHTEIVSLVVVDEDYLLLTYYE